MCIIFHFFNCLLCIISKILNFHNSFWFWRWNRNKKLSIINSWFWYFCYIYRIYIKWKQLVFKFYFIFSNLFCALINRICEIRKLIYLRKFWYDFIKIYTRVYFCSARNYCIGKKIIFLYNIKSQSSIFL